MPWCAVFCREHVEFCNLLGKSKNQIAQKYWRTIQVESDDVVQFGEICISPIVLELCSSLKKSELFQLLQHYKLSVDASLNKSQVRYVVLKYLVDEEIIRPMEAPGETTSPKSMTGGTTAIETIKFEKCEKSKIPRLNYKSWS